MTEMKKKKEHDIWLAIMTIVPFSMMYVLLEIVSLKFEVDNQLVMDLIVSGQVGFIGFILYMILYKLKASSIVKLIFLILLLGATMWAGMYKYQFYIDKELNEKSKEKEEVKIIHINNTPLKI